MPSPSSRRPDSIELHGVMPKSQPNIEFHMHQERLSINIIGHYLEINRLQRL